MLVKFEVRSINRFRTIHTTPKNLGGHVTLARPLLEKVRGHVQTVPGNMC